LKLSKTVWYNFFIKKICIVQSNITGELQSIYPLFNFFFKILWFPWFLTQMSYALSNRNINNKRPRVDSFVPRQVAQAFSQLLTRGKVAGYSGVNKRGFNSATKSKSNTITRTKKKSSFERVPMENGSMSLTVHNRDYVPRSMAYAFNSCGLRSLNTNQAYRLSAAIGLQTNYTDASASNNKWATWTQYELNQIATAVGSSLDTSQAKLLLEDGILNLDVTNAGQTTIKLRFYDVVAKRDLGVNPVTSYSSGSLNMDGSDLSTTVGNSPYQYPEFTTVWHIVKCTEIALGAGEVHTHIAKNNLRKVINTSDVTDNDLGPYWRNQTMCTFVQFHGYPLHDTNTKTTVSTASCAIDIVMTKTLRYRCLDRGNWTDINVNNINGAGVLANAELINPTTEAVIQPPLIL
jgi:hypothetical protein